MIINVGNLKVITPIRLAFDRLHQADTLVSGQFDKLDLLYELRTLSLIHCLGIKKPWAHALFSSQKHFSISLE